MRGKLVPLEPGHFRPLLENGIHRLRIERALRNRAPAADPPKHAASADLRGCNPGVEGFDRPARQIDDVILFTTKDMPKWNPMNVCSYHLQEAGATPVQELAYALATAIAEQAKG